MVKPTVLQAMSSGFIGGFGTATYLVVSYLVDHKYGYDTANLIGLVASSVLDFYLQQLVFVGSISSKPQFIWKFIYKKIDQSSFVNTIPYDLRNTNYYARLTTYD